MGDTWGWAREQMGNGNKVRRRCWFLNMFMKETKSNLFGLFLQVGDREVDLLVKITHTTCSKRWGRLIAHERPYVSDWELFGDIKKQVEE